MRLIVLAKPTLHRSQQDLGKYNRSITSHPINLFHLNELWRTQMDWLTPIGFLTAHTFIRATDGDWEDSQQAITVGFSL